MSEESKDKPFDLGPILPMFGAGVDLGERLGTMDTRLKQLEAGQLELKQNLKELDAKFEAKIDAVDSRVDKCLVAINRLDERTQLQGRLLLALGGGTLAAVIAGIIIQLSR